MHTSIPAHAESETHANNASAWPSEPALAAPEVKNSDLKVELQNLFLRVRQRTQALARVAALG